MTSEQNITRALIGKHGTEADAFDTPEYVPGEEDTRPPESDAEQYSFSRSGHGQHRNRAPDRSGRVGDRLRLWSNEGAAGITKVKDVNE